MGIEKLFRESYKTLSSQWGNAIGATLIFTFIVAVLSFIGGIISIFLELSGISYLYAQLLGNLISQPLIIIICAPLLIGFYSFMLNISRNTNPEISTIFSGFKKKWGKYILVYIFYLVAVYAGLILFIIPGIYVIIIFSQTWFIMVEDDDISAYNALVNSS